MMNKRLRRTLLCAFSLAWCIPVDVLAQAAAQPAKPVLDLIQLAKSKRGTLNFGSAGNGSPGHLAGEMSKSAAGVDRVHVPFKGAGPAVKAFVAGQIQVMSAPMVAVLPQVKAGLHGLSIVSWFGFFVPMSTPGAVVDRLHQETVMALRNADTVERFAKEGAEPSGQGPAGFATCVAQESARYAKVLKDKTSSWSDSGA